MNILVTGANGQLGNELRIVAGMYTSDSAAGAGDRWFFSDVTEQDGPETIHLDITDREAVAAMVREHNIQAIVNCAAYTNVEAAEDNFDLAEKLNATAPQILAETMKSVGGVLFHISTDYVFGKEPYNIPCREDQKGTPTGVYGLTKLHGEQAILASGCDHVIIRTGWLYSEFGKNFVKTMLQLTDTRPQLNVVFDQVGTPTYALDLAKAIFHILGTRSYQGRSGIYHFSNEGVCSWFDFAKMIAEYAGNTGCEILPCHSDEFPSKVIRPSYSVLDKTLIKQNFGLKIPYWTDSLKICIDRIRHK